jgi:hypothetical protein
MKQRKLIVWEATDLDEKFSIYNTVIYNLRHIVKIFQQNYLNISKFNASVHNYSVSFSYVEIDDIIIIKYKTDFLTNEKELFRFDKKRTAINTSEIPAFQIIKIYNNLHILYEYFKNNCSKFNFKFYTTDKDPSDNFNFDKYPEYNNGGYDYFVARLNDEITTEELYKDKNFNLSLYNGNVIDFNHEKVQQLREKITNYYVDSNLDGARAGFAVPDFINKIIVPLTANVWSKWKRFDVQKIEEYYGGGKSILGFRVKNKDGSIEEIKFKKYVLSGGKNGLQLIEKNYNEGIAIYYFNVINNIKNEELKLSIFNYYIIPYLKSSAYRNEYLNDFIYFDIGFLVNEILFDSVIPENYIDIINQYLDKVSVLPPLTLAEIYTGNININIYKLELIVTTITCIYYREYYAYSKCLYPIIDNVISLIAASDNTGEFRPRYMYTRFNEMMKIFQKNYVPTFYENTEHFFKDHKYYDLSIQYLYNFYRLYTYDGIGEWRYAIVKNMALLNVYYDNYGQSIILNVLLSKFFESPYKDMLLKQCKHLVTSYYEYRSKSFSYTYTNNIGKKGQGFVKQSIYDIGMIYTINILTNKMI